MTRYLTPFLFLILFTACKKKNETTSSTTPECSGTPSFSATVNPLMQLKCATSGCHASGSSNGPGALTTYQAIKNNASSIRTAVSNGSMPKSGSLTAEEKSNIICWIDGGAPQN